ncbi:MAG TPA: metal ABC transporter substrate-binding protein [Micromonosporaceae bacterium]|nr:metal ABC transporter substrate-binding protein [Micromonosporaceae bacterium]
MTHRSALRTLAVLAATALAAGSAVACSNGTDGADSGRLNAVAAFYPLQFVTERIGGDAVKVTNLTKPGVDPHDMELSPSQVGQVSRAKVIVYLKGFQPAVDDAVEQQDGGRAFDVAGVQPLLTGTGGHSHDHGSGTGGAGSSGAPDPHVWLDPTRLATIGDRLAERFGQIDPDHAADYSARAATLRRDLEQLDREYTQGLQTCERREVVVSHAAFGYLTDRYRLEQISVAGLTPEDEPTPRRLAEVIEEARRHQATTIFFETLVNPKVAETIAEEVGVRTAVLDPIEGLKPGSNDDYFSVMRANLATLKPALGCS